MNRENSCKTAPRGFSPSQARALQAKVPCSIAAAFNKARFTALSKKNGGARGIATGYVSTSCGGELWSHSSVLISKSDARRSDALCPPGPARIVLDTFSALPRMLALQPPLLFDGQPSSRSWDNDSGEWGTVTRQKAASVVNRSRFFFFPLASVFCWAFVRFP